jgi:hypothetical protein
MFSDLKVDAVPELEAFAGSFEILLKSALTVTDVDFTIPYLLLKAIKLYHPNIS